MKTKTTPIPNNYSFFSNKLLEYLQNYSFFQVNYSFLPSTTHFFETIPYSLKLSETIRNLTQLSDVGSQLVVKNAY